MELYLGEKVKDVYGFEGVYAVTSFGRMWCYPQGRRKGKWFKFNRSKKKYIQVGLKQKGQERIYRYLHRVVAKAFIPNPENKKQVNHKNGDRYDCKVTNLEWMTARENIQHAVDTGLNPYLKLSLSQKMEICRYRSEGTPAKALSKMYGINVNNVYKILNNYMPEYLQLGLAA